MILDGPALEGPSRIADYPRMTPCLRFGPCLLLTLSLSLVVACKGDTGEQGPEGPEGPEGPPGEIPGPEIELEPNGLVGRVMEPNMRPVPGGTVYLVPAGDVQALAETQINLFASPSDTATLGNDEPLEDLIDTNGDAYAQAAVDESGVYRFETLPDDDDLGYFIVWLPAIDDAGHLPGGDGSNAAFPVDSLIGMRMDIRVSSQPSELATYVGSSTCMGCHGLHSTARTAHNVGLQVPGKRSILQDIEPWPDFDEALEKFGSTTLFFYDCDGTALAESKCQVSEGPPPANPPAEVFFTVALEEDEGSYSVALTNVKNNADPNSPQRYDVMLTYGGALGKQQYLMRRRNDATGTLSYFLLPVQYNYEGVFGNGTEVGDGSSDDWPWRDYRSDLWYNFDNDELLDRSDGGPNDESFNSESFDNNCAGCHMTGYRLEGSDADGWSARAVVDPGGAFDYDGDGRPELINTGCEACHGPGSDHLMPSPNGRHIVSPGLLTPGRAETESPGTAARRSRVDGRRRARG